MDHNATTMMSEKTLEVFAKSANHGNPSSFYASEEKEGLDSAQKYIREICGLNEKDWHVIFTSGATESNVTIIRMAVEAQERKGKTRPHIISSVIEHPSILSTLDQMGNRIKVTLVPSESDGTVSPEKVKKAIKASTCLCTIMTANNETGSINDVKAIHEICKKEGIPFHTDSTQSFGKSIVPSPETGDAFSVSFHKVYGPVGVGMLILNAKVADVFGYQSLLPGSQNGGWRAGTENYPGIMASISALKDTMTDRLEKNQKLEELRHFILTSLMKKYQVWLFSEWSLLAPEIKKAQGPTIVLLGNDDNGRHLPNTLFLAMYVPDVLPDGNRFCNRTLMTDMLKKGGVVVSIGSACKTDAHKASHVVVALTEEQEVLCGVIRVSLGDHTTLGECKKFVQVYLDRVNAQLNRGLGKKNK